MMQIGSLAIKDKKTNKYKTAKFLYTLSPLTEQTEQKLIENFTEIIFEIFKEKERRKE